MGNLASGAFPAVTWLQPTLFWLSALCAIGSTVMLLRERGFRLPVCGRHILLADAAQRCYDESHAADIFKHDSPKDRLRYHAFAIHADGKDGLLHLSGIRAPAKKPLPISVSWLNETYPYDDDMNKLRSRTSSKIEWDQVKLLRKEFRAHIKRQKAFVEEYNRQGGLLHWEKP
jgi:hypothetical protein